MGAYEINDQLLTNEEKKELTINKDQQKISRKKEVFRKFVSNPIAVLGSVTLLLIIVFSLVGESLTPFTASEQVKRQQTYHLVVSIGSEQMIWEEIYGHVLGLAGKFH